MTTPFAERLRAVRERIRAAERRFQRRPDAVRLLAATKTQSAAAVAALVDDGHEVIGCATSADAAGIELAALGVVVGSQDDHAALCAWADRVVAFA